VQKKTSCTVPHSKLRQSIAKILKEEGFIADYSEGANEKGHKKLTLKLKYVQGQPALTDIQRASTPGRRMYYKSNEIPQVLGGLGVAIISTSKGVLQDRVAKKNNAGGELVCTVW